MHLAGDAESLEVLQQSLPHQL